MAKYLTEEGLQHLIDTIKTRLGTKVNLAGDTMTGELKTPSIEIGANAAGVATNVIEVGDGNTAVGATKKNVFAVSNAGTVTAKDYVDGDGNRFSDILALSKKAFIPKGTVEYSTLASMTLDASKIGWVYDVINTVTTEDPETHASVSSLDKFTINDKFVEYVAGADNAKYYPSGTNVVVVEVTPPVEADPTADPPVAAVPGVYKFDIFPGFVDTQSIIDSIEEVDAEDIDDMWEDEEPTPSP